MRIGILGSARVGTGLLAIFAGIAAAQAPGRPTTVSGQITITNNGMSTIPAFTLGDPAALFYLFVRHGPVSIEPEFRTGFDGMPWAFLVWARYRLQRDRLSLGISAHPAFNFKPATITNNGVTRDMIIVRRYLVGELTPTLTISRYAAVGATYLHLHGVESDVPKHTNFAALRSSLLVPLPATFGLQFTPQAYYLHMGGASGTYVFGQLALSHRQWPLSIATAANAPMHTTLVGGNEFTWNVSVTYVIQ